MLAIMEREGVLTRANRQTIEQYFRSLTELRSIYCHNKPPRTIIKTKLDKVFGSFLWEPYHHQISTTCFDFDVAYVRFDTVTQRIMALMESAVKASIKLRSEMIISEWQKEIIGWYLQSDDLRIRSIYRLRSIYGIEQFPSDINDKIEQDFKNSRLIVEDLFKELVERVDSSATQIHSQEVWRIVVSEFLV